MNSLGWSTYFFNGDLFQYLLVNKAFTRLVNVIIVSTFFMSVISELQSTMDLHRKLRLTTASLCFGINRFALWVR